MQFILSNFVATYKKSFREVTGNDASNWNVNQCTKNEVFN